MSSFVRPWRVVARTRAFTLVELLIAVALTTIFLTMVATVFTQAQGSFSRSRAAVSMAQEARAIFELMARDLQAATLVKYKLSSPSADPPSGPDLRGYFLVNKGDATAYANDPPGTGPNPPARTGSFPDEFGGQLRNAYSGRLDLPRLYFVSNSVQSSAVSTISGEAQPFFISYQLVWDGKKVKNRLAADGTGSPQPRCVYRLARRVVRAAKETYTDPDFNPASDRYPFGNIYFPALDTDRQEDKPTADVQDGYKVEADPIGFHVLWVRYRFFDNRGGKDLWVDDEWTATDVLPLLVEVRLTLTDPELREEASYTSRFQITAASR